MNTKKKILENNYVQLTDGAENYTITVPRSERQEGRFILSDAQVINTSIDYFILYPDDMLTSATHPGKVWGRSNDESLPFICHVNRGASELPTTVKAVNDIVPNVPLGQPASVDVTTNDIGAVDKTSVELYTLGG